MDKIAEIYREIYSIKGQLLDEINFVQYDSLTDAGERYLREAMHFHVDVDMLLQRYRHLDTEVKANERLD
jgi:hypothetical protein